MAGPSAGLSAGRLPVRGQSSTGRRTVSPGPDVLAQLCIEGYQSLAKIRIRLGQFTVITGPTGAGKSAVIRAVRLAVFNARGTGYITRGQKSCQVTVSGPDWAVRIERGGRGKDAYRIATQGAVIRDPEASQVFTKLGGQVPAQVASLLQLSELNFADQFAAPFLLSASGGDVARTLGELTNVTLVFTAAAEANRRRLRIAQQLRDRQAERDGLLQRAQGYATLPARLRAIAQAEQAAARLEELEGRAERLRSLLSGYGTYQEIAAQAAGAEVSWGAPDLSTAAALVQRVSRLAGLLADGETALQDQDRAAADAEQAESSSATHRLQLRRALLAAGQCPTCGQQVSAEHAREGC